MGFTWEIAYEGTPLPEVGVGGYLCKRHPQAGVTDKFLASVQAVDLIV